MQNFRSNRISRSSRLRACFLPAIIAAAFIFSLVTAAPDASADIVSSRPSDEQVKAATAQCRLGSARLPRKVIGISDPHTLETRVQDLIIETGVDWVRAEFHWSQIEPVPGGGYRWGPYDAMVDRFSRAGVRIQAILTYIPENIERDWNVVDKRFQAFAEAAIRRYSSRGVHVWEVFNEPNLTGYGWLTKGTKVEPFLGVYTLLLARTNQIVRVVDPQGLVVIGGLASDQHRGLNAETTMDRIYGLGAKNCFDIMAYHPYGYQGKFGQALRRVRNILARHGDANKPIWFNEYGWTDQNSMDLARNNTEKTNPMIAAFAQMRGADGFFWFSVKDYSRRLNAPSFGLADFNGNKRPSFRTFKELVDRYQ